MHVLAPMDRRPCDHFRVVRSEIRRFVVDAVVVEFDPRNALMAELNGRDSDALFAYAQDIAAEVGTGTLTEIDAIPRIQSLAAVLRNQGRLGDDGQTTEWRHLDGQWLPQEPKSEAA